MVKGQGHRDLTKHIFVLFSFANYDKTSRSLIE